MASELPRTLGRYTLERLLARGGMGEIYLALSKGAEGIDKPCVIKSLPPGLAHDDEFVTRFLDEARIVTTLSHGNIAQVFEVGREGDEFFLAMEYVDGRDLRQVLARCFDRKIKPPPEMGLFIVQELLRGLSYAHRKNDSDKPLNLIHRDICPQNVMVSFEGAVKLIDFGLAKSALKSLATNPTILLGKVAYMSPEQARREKLDPRSDVYSAGVVLFEVLTGKRRYNEKNPQELLQRVRTPGPFLINSELGLPEPILKTLAKALDPTVDGRYQSAEEFRKDLSGVLVDLYPRMDAERLGEFIRELFVDIKSVETARTVEFEKPSEPKPASKPTPPTAKPSKPEPAAIATPKSQKTPEPAPAPKTDTDNELTEQFPEHMLAELFGSQPDSKNQNQNTNPSYSAPTERRSYEEVPEEDQGGATIPAIQMPTEEDFAARAAARAQKAAQAAQEKAEQEAAAQEPPETAEEVAATQQMQSLSEPAPEPPRPAPKAPAPVKPTPAKLQVTAQPQPTKPATPAQSAKPVAQQPAKPAPQQPTKQSNPPPPAKPAKPKVEAKPVKPKSPPPQEPEEDDDPPITQGPRTEVISYPKPSSNRKQREQKQKQTRLRAIVLVGSLLLLIPSAAILTAFLVNPIKVRTLFGIQASKLPPLDTTPTSLVASTSAPQTQTSASNTTKPSNPTTNVATAPSPAEEAVKQAIASLNNSLRLKNLLRDDSPAISKAFASLEDAKKRDVAAIEKIKKEGLSAIVSTKIDADFVKKKTERLEALLKKKGLTKDPTVLDLQKQLKSEKKVEKKNEVLNKIFKSIEK